MSNADAHAAFVKLQRLVEQYCQIGKRCRERAPSGRSGVVVGVEPNGVDLHWLVEGEIQPRRNPSADLEISDPKEPTSWFGPALETAMLEGAYWPSRFLIQLGLAHGPVLWPGAIALAIMKARGFAPRDPARAEKLLRIVLPFIEGLPPEDAQDVLANTPELRQLLAHTSPSQKSQPIRFNTLAQPPWRHKLAAELPLRLMLTGALPSLGLEPEEGDEDDDDDQDLGPDDFDHLRPLDPIYDVDQRPVFFLASSDESVLVLTEEGNVESMEHEDFGLDFDDTDSPMTGEEFSDVLEMAWHTRTAAPFILGGQLACRLQDLEAEVFWCMYGYRWLSAHDEPGEALIAMHWACAALAQQPELATTLTQQYPDLAEAQRRKPLDVEEASFPSLPVAELAAHWRPEFGLLPMARRVHDDPQFLQGGLDIFSFGPAPFEHGAPPPPPFDAHDTDPYAIWRHPGPSAPPPAPAPQTASSPPSPEPAPTSVPAVAPAPLMPVQFAEHALLQAEWNLPSGQDAFVAARDVLFGWLSAKLGVAIPERWATGAHEAEHKGLRLEVEASEELTAMRFEHPDHEHPARRWRVELVIGAGAGGRQGVVTLRLLVHDATRLPAPVTATPRFLRDLLQTPGLHLAGRPLAQPWRVGTNVDWLALRDVLQQADRDFVLLVSGPDERLELSPALAPLALHVQLLPASLPDYARRRAPIVAGTCHLYGLGQNQPRVVPANFAQLTPALWAAHADRGALPALPTFADLRRQLRDLALVRRLRAAAPDPAPDSDPVERPGETANTPTEPPTGPSELEELLQLELEELLAKNRGLEADIDALTTELREAKAALYAARVAAGEPVPAPVELERPRVPASFAELETWLPLLGDRLDVIPKAVKEAMSITDYQNEAVAIAAIDALHAHYWPMVMRGDEQARSRWNAFLKDNRLRCGPVGTAPESSRYGRAYEVMVGRKSYTLDMHIQGHSARDTRRCLRVYFAVDREREKVILGSFPKHLPCHIHYTS